MTRQLWPHVGAKANTALIVARGVGAEIAFNSSGGADAWIMLMPLGAGNVLTTVDGRGPYSAGLYRRVSFVTSSSVQRRRCSWVMSSAPPKQCPRLNLKI
jgi:hypothetical protein